MAITSSGGSSQILRLHSRIASTVRTPNVFLLSVWPLSLSLATTRKISVDFSSSGYLDVSVPRVPPIWLCIHHTVIYSSYMWFPNSEICGSKLICSSPQLIAACHVLRRLPMPRHSPYALYSLNFPFRFSSINPWVFHELFEFANNCCLLGLNCNKNYLLIQIRTFAIFIRTLIRIPSGKIVVFLPYYGKTIWFLILFFSIICSFLIRFSMNIIEHSIEDSVICIANYWTSRSECSLVGSMW